MATEKVVTVSVDSSNKSSGVLTTAEYSDIEAESSELLRSACELVHVRCAKLIMVKAKVTEPTLMFRTGYCCNYILAGL